MPESFAEGLVGIVLDGRYRLDAVLGQGGMGAVFRAQHLAMDRRVAVKLLKPHLTQSAEATQRFLREARSTLKVDSPHVVKLLDFGITPTGDYYMALEYLDGRTVMRELEIDGPFSPARTIHIARQALHALGAAHDSGLVHRDLKPDNILLMRVDDDPDFTKLLDFGVAKLMEGTARSSQSQLALTQTGTVFGTPEFMSPEQACGHPVDGRSDLYSLAATMFAMLTGCGLFEGKTALEWLSHHVRTPPPRLVDVAPDLAPYTALDDLLARCLAKSRDDRPGSAMELDGLLASIEPEVARGGAAARSSARLRASAASGYVDALPDPDATLLPQPPADPAAADPEAIVSLRPGTWDGAAPPRSRAGVLIGIGAALVVGTVAIAIGVAASRSGPAVAPAPTVAGSSSAPGDAAITSDAAPAPRDASIVAVDAGQRPDARRVAPPDPPRPRPDQDTDARAVAVHIANAERALRDGNRLRQLAEADLALKIAPRHAHARFLLADALIKGGDLDRGCAQLRALGNDRKATQRALGARCPPPVGTEAQVDSGR